MLYLDYPDILIQYKNMKFMGKLAHFSVLFSLVVLCTAFTACASSAEKQEIDVFTVDLKSRQITISEIELQFDPAMGIGKIKKGNAAVIYFPQEDAVCLQFRQDFFTFHQFWNREGRIAFIEALEKYNDDFEARNLNSKNRRSKRSYNTVQGYLTWQQFNFSVLARGNMDVELGYVFKDRAPYFTVNQREAEYIDENYRDNNRTSATMTLYFTRAQAAELAALFEQHFLNELVSPGANN